MRVVFRVDSSGLVGSGHMMRCLTLANTLRSDGADVLFVTRAWPGHLISQLERHSYSVCKLPMLGHSDQAGGMQYTTVFQQRDAAATIEAIGNQRIDWLVVDHYELDITWERILRQVADNILVIDDLANRKHDCNLLLDQNYLGEATQSRYNGLLPVNCRCLLGPTHALLHPDYAQLRKSLPETPHQVRNVLIFFGSSDPQDLTGKAIDALSQPELTHLTADVVLGINHPDAAAIEKKSISRTGITLHRDLPTLAPLMARADIAIGAGGSTNWERLCLGLPTIIVTVADNQVPTVSALHTDNLVNWLGDKDSVTTNDISTALCQILNENRLQDWSQRCLAVCDGEGSNRVLSHMSAAVHQRM